METRVRFYHTVPLATGRLVAIQNFEMYSGWNKMGFEKRFAIESSPGPAWCHLQFRLRTFIIRFRFKLD